LKYFIAQAGSLQGGLRFYVGAASGGDGGYADKVMRERSFLMTALGAKDLAKLEVVLPMQIRNRVLKPKILVISSKMNPQILNSVHDV
jgi:hypothetical protein